VIRYPTALVNINSKVSKAWIAKAKERTEIFQSLGRYAEEQLDHSGKVKQMPPFWSDVKGIFVQHQYGKCIFCETQLESGEGTAVQWDLEHFRPKSAVRSWPPRKSGLQTKYAGLSFGRNAEGYHLLAYCPSNYAAACKSCNSFKSDYFPIASDRVSTGIAPADYVSEDAYLIYPLGVEGLDPRDLIVFDGAKAVPKHTSLDDTRKWLQAEIIIDFFRLNREGLELNRAKWLYETIWQAVKLSDSGDLEANEILRLAKTEGARYTSCATSFIELCSSNREKALEKVATCKQVIAFSE
jgi:hypothetical protein